MPLLATLPRGTPLYGQPSWWGDGDADDENSFKQETKSKKHDGSISESKEARRGEKSKEDGLHSSPALDSSYFEVPTKEGHMANNGIHEIPTKDTEDAPSQSHTTAAQGHASFTIEFDNTSPGKVTIKDHVSKFTSDHHRSRTKKSTAGSGGSGSKDLTTLQAAMMASESKVADWLAHNDPTLVHTESTEDDSKSTKSIKSDVPVHLKRLKGTGPTLFTRLCILFEMGGKEADKSNGSRISCKGECSEGEKERKGSCLGCSGSRKGGDEVGEREAERERCLWLKVVIVTAMRTADQKSIKTPPSATIGLPARTDSISPESDLDTASTASHAAAEAGGKAAAGGMQKRKSLSSMHREKSNMSTASKTTSGNGSARERLERKAKGRTAEVTGRTRSAQPAASSRARQPSLDLTDDDQTSSFPISDILSSDQETYSGPLGNSVHRRGSEDVLHSKLDGRSSKTSMSGASKTSRNLQAATASSLNKQASLPQPRPTRASLLRRARLGDTSDTDLADADRVSVASEVSTTSSTSKPPSGRKGLSRLDMLAQPRRNRVGSVSARSDSECTVSRPSTASPRLSAETALRLGLRSTTPTENRLSPRMRANSVSKLNEPKAKTTTSGYLSSSSRWRRLPPEYGSTSEEEFGSSRNSAKHGTRPHVRPHHLVPHRGSRLSSATSSGPAGVAAIPGGAGIKHRMKEQEEYIRDWTAHSEEIARISQDLAKDLAILAREIHDVAGEIDSVSSSGTAPSTTVSTAATTPGSAIDTREELVDRVFDESLKFRKIPPVISSNKPPEINGKPVEHQPRAPDGREPRALRRRTWNREEAVLDSLLIHSVSQLSTKIRHSVDRTAGKIRYLLLRAFPRLNISVHGFPRA
uniref:Centrosomal protein 170Aa n=1 Tax=Xiphophorus couchianus TaxID=32473 RepID=A0A3B5M2X8_9TELE